MADYDYSALKVLIADDSPLMRQVLRGMLEMIGVRRFAAASDADSALDQIQRFNPDLIITDWNMPPTDGLGMVRKLRTDPSTPNPFVPVIMVTGYTEEHRVLEARDGGITEFLAKPVTAAALYERLRAVVEDHRNWVRCSGFIGPDRRRGRREAFRGPERRASAAA